MLLILFLFGLPNWAYARRWDWGYGLSSLFGFLLPVLLVLILFDIIRWI